MKVFSLKNWIGRAFTLTKTGTIVVNELACHFPYAVFSVALSLATAAILGYFSFGAKPEVVEHGSHILFHTFHFMHIVFAASGTVLTFLRFSNKAIKGILVGACSAVFFCVLSDSIMPYLVGEFMGVTMDFHICFVTEVNNVLPFLLVGLFNGWVLSKHNSAEGSFYSIWSHFMHIFVSSLASMLYIISHGMHDWYDQMGILFMFLIIAVVIPCTLSDVVVPIYFSQHDLVGGDKKDECCSSKDGLH
jgi:hypothetical protein